MPEIPFNPLSSLSGGGGASALSGVAGATPYGAIAGAASSAISATMGAITAMAADPSMTTSGHSGNAALDLMNGASFGVNGITGAGDIIVGRGNSKTGGTTSGGVAGGAPAAGSFVAGRAAPGLPAWALYAGAGLCAVLVALILRRK